MGNTEISVLFSQGSLEEFLSHYGEVVDDIVKQTERCVLPSMRPEIDWMIKVLEKNVLEGSFHFRGLLTVDAFKHFVKEEPTAEELKMTIQMGWVNEFKESFLILMDDMNENNAVRNAGGRRPTWHNNESIGMAAVNDSLLLFMLSLRMLQLFLGETPFHKQIRDGLRHSVWKKLCGNRLAFATGKNNLRMSLTMKRYSQIVKLKQSSIPVQTVKSGIILAGHGEDKKLLEKVENILEEIFEYLQIHIDFYTVFGIGNVEEPRSKVIKNVLGETADSLKDVSWLLVKAAECDKITDDEFQFIAKVFKQHEAECYQNIVEMEKVKILLKELGIVKSFWQYRDSAFNKIMINIEKSFGELEGYDLNHSPKIFFHEFLSEIKGSL